MYYWLSGISPGQKTINPSFCRTHWKTSLHQ